MIGARWILGWTGETTGDHKFGGYPPQSDSLISCAGMPDEGQGPMRLAPTIDT